jgi:hypothetical protein
MSTLKVNKLRDTSGSTDAIVLDLSGGAVLAGVTTISTARVTTGITSTSLQVGAAVTITESGIEASGVGITCANINGAQIGGRRNIIINGEFQIAQRSGMDTAVTATTDSEYLSVDRFRWRSYGGAGRASFTQVSGDYPSSDFRYSLKAICTTVNSSEGSHDQGIGYTVEGYDMQRLGWGRSNPKNCTLSFWAKTSVAGTYCVSFRQGAATRSQIKEYTLSANTWTKVKLTITGDSDSTWLNSDYTTVGKGILIEWSLGKSNSKNTSTVNSWISGNKVASDNQVRWIATLGATFSLTGVQLEVGDHATAFEHRSYGEELQLCARYFQQFEGGSNNFFASGFTAGNDFYGGSTLPMGKMRAAPTIAVDGTLSHLNYTHVAVAANASSLTNQGGGNASFVLRLQSTTNTTDNAGAYARIVNSSTNLTFDAEI